jgi:hypothetical protein
MAFWSKRKTGSAGSTGRDNPFSLDPDAFDKGAGLNRLAAELRRVASKEVNGPAPVTALQTALGHEVVAMVMRRNPHLSPDQMQHVIDQVLDTIGPGVREAAYIAANLPEPQYDEDKELTEEEFKALTMRIIDAATKNNTPVSDAISATAKAMGTLICIFSERGVSADELIQFIQKAVADFARDALAQRRQNR